MMTVWVIEHCRGTQYYDHENEVVGVYESEKTAKDAFSSVKWEHLDFTDEDGEVNQAWEAPLNNEDFLVLYSLVLNKTYSFSFGKIPV